MAAGGFEPAEWRSWYFIIIGMISASALAVPLVNLFVTLVLPTRALPRLDFSKGIPDIHRTMVIVPTLLSTAQEIDDLFETLEIRYLGNRDANLFFALLTDFRDATEQTLPEDDALLAHARAAVTRAASRNFTHSSHLLPFSIHPGHVKAGIM